MDTCLPFLLRQIGWVNPWLIVTLGRVPSQYLIKTSDSIRKMRGKMYQVVLEGWRQVFVSYHPAAVVYDWQKEVVLKKDFKTLKSIQNATTSREFRAE
jgi:DNA polymerase